MVTSKNDLPRIASQIERALAQLVKKTGFNIEAKWKADVRVDTGTYRNSIQTRVEGPMKVSAGSPIEYGPPNEFGTRHMAGRPSATTAADTEGKNFEKAVRDIERQLR